MICRRDIGWLHLGNFHDRYVTDKRLYELVRNFGLRLLASFLQRFFPSISFDRRRTRVPSGVRVIADCGSRAAITFCSFGSPC